jgi:hypothetical protein
MMPEAARERVASPPAGTALAPHYSLPAAARPIGRDLKLNVTVVVTRVNVKETKFFDPSYELLHSFRNQKAFWWEYTGRTGSNLCSV